MSGQPIAILNVGMVTGVGLTAPASCAAIRCGINNFQETRFMAGGGEWILGSEVPLNQPWRGKTKLLKMLTGALRECIDLLRHAPTEDIPLLLCVAEEDRPGRQDGLDRSFCEALQQDLGRGFHPESRIIAKGRVGGAVALHIARRLLYRDADAPAHVIVAGVDSYLIGPTLNEYDARLRVQTAANSDGFIPGEAAAAVLVGRPRTSTSSVVCTGLGFGTEPAPIESGEPLRAHGMAQAYRAALADAGCGFEAIDFRINDISGAQYAFKEAALALARTKRSLTPELDMWHPADCVGEVGAAVVPLTLGVAKAANLKGYAPGRGALCHFAADGSERAAMVVRLVGDSRDRSAA